MMPIINPPYTRNHPYPIKRGMALAGRVAEVGERLLFLRRVQHGRDGAVAVAVEEEHRAGV